MKNIKKLEEYALSDTDIQKIVAPHKTKIWNYPDLRTVGNLHDMFDDLGRAAILYDVISPYSGHWCGLLKHDNISTIEFFDPYGLKYDAEKKWLTPQKLQQLGELEPYLTNLIDQARTQGYKIIWNKFKFQSSKNNINTCGRWTGARLLFKDLNIDQFKEMVIKSGLAPDDFITRLTNEIIHK